LKAILDVMREQCELVLEHEVGAHRSKGLRQERAARAAADLMDEHGLPVKSNSPTSSYRVVARLLFAAITGRVSKKGSDIERACKDIARDHRRNREWRKELTAKLAAQRALGWELIPGTEISPDN
jgi:hypothetical protein